MIACKLVVLVDYHQLILQPGEALPVLDGTQPPALVQVVDGLSLILTTGLRSGPVTLMVLEDDHVPADGWEERQDVLLEVHEPLYVTAPDMPNEHLIEPVFTPTSPGLHSVSVLARGLQTHPGELLELDVHPARTTWSCSRRPTCRPRPPRSKLGEAGTRPTAVDLALAEAAMAGVHGR